MGIYLELVNHDHMFATAAVPPIVINDVETVTDEQRQFIKRVISTSYDTDLLSNEPRCGCDNPELVGGYKIDVICPNCRTPVREQFDQQLHPLVWIRSPNGVGKLINPMVLRMLLKKFTHNTFSYVEWLINTNFTGKTGVDFDIEEIERVGLRRGYNHFVEDIQLSVDRLYRLKPFRSKYGPDDPLRRLLRENADRITSNHIPLPNKSLLVVENTAVGVYVDPIIMGAVDAIKTICSIDTQMTGLSIAIDVSNESGGGDEQEIRRLSVRQKENRTAKTLLALAEFYDKVYQDILASKNGIFRKHVYGTRNYFSMRAVISSNTRAHSYDEIYLPWAGAITMFKLHLLNKLIRRGFTPNQATALLLECTYRYDALIDEIFNELLNESRDNCFWIGYVRNPSLTRASYEAMRVTKIKTDPDDPTITMSILAVRGFNADFDGDQMNVMYVIDNMTADEMAALAPHKNMYSLNAPRTITSVASIPKPVISTISNWYSRNDDDHQRVVADAFMQSIAVG